MTSSNYQLPAIAAVAGLAIAASTLALSSSPRSVEQRRRKRRIKSKLQRGKSWLTNYPPPPMLARIHTLTFTSDMFIPCRTRREIRFRTYQLWKLLLLELCVAGKEADLVSL